MSSRLKHGLLIGVALIALFIIVEYGYGAVIEYIYDASGNLIEKKVRTDDTTPPTTTASPAGGTYGSAQSVTLSCIDNQGGSGCDKTYYTTNGSTPTTSSPVYTSPINISVTTTLKFFSKDLVGNSESVKTRTYTINTNSPSGTITINSGAASTNSTSVTLTLSCTNPQGCSQMKFSNDNVTYSTAQAYATTKAWTLTTGDGTKTVYAKFKVTSGNWSIPYSDTILLDTTPPVTTASPAPGVYSAAQTVTLTCSDGTGSGCDKIYYTTDGETPTTSSPVYSSPINILRTTILKYFAKDLAGNSEAVKTGTYIIDAALCPNLPVRIGGTSYVTLQEAYNAAANGNVIKSRASAFAENLIVNRDIAVTLDGGYDCWFTTNAGGKTTIYGSLTTTPGGGTLTIKNFVLGVTPVGDTTPPVTTSSPPEGFYTSAQSVTLTCTDAGGSGCDKIYYTIGGTLPTTSSSVYSPSSPIPITQTSTLRFFAKDLAGNSEPVKTAIYIIETSPIIPPDTTPPTSTAYPPGDTYDSAQLVTLTCTDGKGSACYEIYYTTNGDPPSTSSPAYSSPIIISATTTLKFFARDLAGNTEAVKTEVYTIDTGLPVTTPTPGPGTYDTPQTVTLSCSDASGSGCDKIYYTTDGTTPDIFSVVYSSPIHIAETTRLKFFGKDFAGNTEAVKTAVYTIDPAACNFAARIGSTSYTTLQEAYIAAANGNVIKSRGSAFAENLTVNKNIAVTLDGGYDCWFTTNAGGATTIKGLTTMAGGGTITVKNFIIDKFVEKTPPVTTATPAGGTYDTSLLVTLTCDDGAGVGCDKIYYTTDGSTPLTTSQVYTSPIEISVSTALRFFAKDLFGNTEAVKTQVYTVIRSNLATKLVDFDMDGRSDLAVYRASTGVWWIKHSSDASTYSVAFGGPGYQHVAGDYDGDGKTDIAVYHSATGLWFIKPSSGGADYNVGYGGSGYTPVPADYDGDWKTDLAVYHSDSGLWFIKPSSGGADYYVGYGGPGYVPAAGDYDGDGKTDIAAYHSASGVWYIKKSSDGTEYSMTWGGDPTDKPVPGDYDGDGKTDIAVYRASNGWWIIVPSSGAAPYAVGWGGDPTDKPVPGDYDGDGKTDIAVYRASNGWWIIVPSSGATPYAVGWGGDPSDEPIDMVYTIASTNDITPPTTTPSPPGGTYNTSQSVTLTCSDGSGSGCDKIYYTTNGSTPTTSSPVYSSPINISSTTTLKFFAKDLAGNSEAVKTHVYTIDTTPPTGTITINSGAASTNSTSVTLTLSCSDANGCSQMKFSNDNATYSTAETYATIKAWTLTTGNGTKTVYVKFKDTPGNWSVPYSDTILLDTTPPTTTASPAGGTYGSAQSVTLSCNDGSGSGCDKIYYTTNGSTPTTSSPVYTSPINIAVTTTLKFFGKDFAGNSESVKTQIYTIGSVRIGGSTYTTLQAAYNAAINGDVIKCRAITFIENLTVNRNITVTLDGGYDSTFTTNVGGQTTLKGKITTTVGGGTITIKNFVLTQ